MNQELYELIKDRLTEKIDVSEEEMSILVHELTLLAVSGAEEYISEINESVEYLRSTIKRLNQKLSQIPVGGTS